MTTFLSGKGIQIIVHRRFAEPLRTQDLAALADMDVEDTRKNDIRKENIAANVAG